MADAAAATVRRLCAPSTSMIESAVVSVDRGHVVFADVGRSGIINLQLKSTTSADKVHDAVPIRLPPESTLLAVDLVAVPGTNIVVVVALLGFVTMEASIAVWVAHIRGGDDARLEVGANSTVMTVTCPPDPLPTPVPLVCACHHATAAKSAASTIIIAASLWLGHLHVVQVTVATDISMPSLRNQTLSTHTVKLRGPNMGPETVPITMTWSTALDFTGAPLLAMTVRAAMVPRDAPLHHFHLACLHPKGGVVEGPWSIECLATCNDIPPLIIDVAPPAKVAKGLGRDAPVFALMIHDSEARIRNEAEVVGALKFGVLAKGGTPVHAWHCGTQGHTTYAVVFFTSEVLLLLAMTHKTAPTSAAIRRASITGTGYFAMAAAEIQFAGSSAASSLRPLWLRGCVVASGASARHVVVAALDRSTNTVVHCSVGVPARDDAEMESSTVSGMYLPAADRLASTPPMLLSRPWRSHSTEVLAWSGATETVCGLRHSGADVDLVVDAPPLLVAARFEDDDECSIIDIQGTTEVAICVVSRAPTGLRSAELVGIFTVDDATEAPQLRGASGPVAAAFDAIVQTAPRPCHLLASAVCASFLYVVSDRGMASASIGPRQRGDDGAGCKWHFPRPSVGMHSSSLSRGTVISAAIGLGDASIVIAFATGELAHLALRGHDVTFTALSLTGDAVDVAAVEGGAAVVLSRNKQGGYVLHFMEVESAAGALTVRQTVGIHSMLSSATSSTFAAFRAKDGLILCCVRRGSTAVIADSTGRVQTIAITAVSGEYQDRSPLAAFAEIHNSVLLVCSRDVWDIQASLVSTGTLRTALGEGLTMPIATPDFGGMAASRLKGRRLLVWAGADAVTASIVLHRGRLHRAAATAEPWSVHAPQVLASAATSKRSAQRAIAPLQSLACTSGRIVLVACHMQLLVHDTTTNRHNVAEVDVKALLSAEASATTVVSLEPLVEFNLDGEVHVEAHFLAVLMDAFAAITHVTLAVVLRPADNACLITPTSAVHCGQCGVPAVSIVQMGSPGPTSSPATWAAAVVVVHGAQLQTALLHLERTASDRGLLPQWTPAWDASEGLNVPSPSNSCAQRGLESSIVFLTAASLGGHIDFSQVPITASADSASAAHPSADVVMPSPMCLDVHPEPARYSGETPSLLAAVGFSIGGLAIVAHVTPATPAKETTHGAATGPQRPAVIYANADTPPLASVGIVCLATRGAVCAVDVFGHVHTWLLSRKGVDGPWNVAVCPPSSSQALLHPWCTGSPCVLKTPTAVDGSSKRVIQFTVVSPIDGAAWLVDVSAS
jgi:hypothetical protein